MKTHFSYQEAREFLKTHISNIERVFYELNFIFGKKDYALFSELQKIVDNLEKD